MALATEDTGAGEASRASCSACWFRSDSFSWEGAIQFLAVEYESGIAVGVRAGLARRAFPYVRSAAQLGLAGALLAGLLWRVDLAAVRDELKGATLWWLPLAFAANLGSDWFRAIRWQQFFAPMKRLGVPFLFAVAVLGVATNLVLPLRAGEVVRVQVLRRRTGLKVSSIVATLLSEKLMDIVAFSTFIILGIILYEDAHFLWPLAVAYGCLLTAGIAGARWLAERSQRKPAPEPGTISGLTGMRQWFRHETHWLGAGLAGFRHPRAVVYVLAASVAAWLCEALMYYACGRALGIHLPPAVYLLVVVAATIAVSVPITQAGLGVFELAIAGLLVAFGVDETQAAAFAIFSHVMLALPYFVAGPIAAVALRLNIADILFLRLGKQESVEAVGAEA
jgi:glycosyltransferase 2 family protein